jgi:putative endonuclease
MPHMYILECVDGSYYTGSTTHLELRLKQHQDGCGARHTAKRLPVKLVYCEFFEHVVDAFYREKQVQGWSRKKKQALMASDANLLHRLAVCQNDSHHMLASAPLSQLNSLSQQETDKWHSLGEAGDIPREPAPESSGLAERSRSQQESKTIKEAVRSGENLDSLDI